MTTPVGHAKALYAALEHIAYPDGARLNANSMQRVAREAIAAYNVAPRPDGAVDRALRSILHAWDSLPEGNYSGKAIDRWLNGPMKQAIAEGREALAAYDAAYREEPSPPEQKGGDAN
jgi:hypothetical protein